MAALPSLTISAKAATLGATAAKGSVTAKAAGALGIVGAILSPVMIIFGNYVGYRIGMEESQSDEERNLIKSFYKKILLWSLAGSAVATALVMWRHPSLWALFNIAFISFVITYVVAMLVSLWTSRRHRYDLYARILARDHGGTFPEAAWEYRSEACFLGLPLVHIRIGDRFDVLRGPIKAWIAVGNYAIGGLFAFGGIVIAPIGVGFIVIGLLPYAAVAVGVAAMGGVAMGIWSFGALAIGWESLGCFAVAWKAAMGFTAIAHDFAQGGIAYAAQVNNDVAGQFIRSNWFFRAGHLLGRYSLLLNLLWILPLVVQQQVIARKNKQTSPRA
jgi:hypothetical protein